MPQEISFKGKNGSTRVTTLNLIGDGTGSKKNSTKKPEEKVHDCENHLTWQGGDLKTGEHLYSCRICKELHIKNK